MSTFDQPKVYEPEIKEPEDESRGQDKNSSLSLGFLAGDRGSYNEAIRAIQEMTGSQKNNGLYCLFTTNEPAEDKSTSPDVELKAPRPPKDGTAIDVQNPIHPQTEQIPTKTFNEITSQIKSIAAEITQHPQVKELKPDVAKKLITELDSEDFATRERASKELAAAGLAALPGLEATLKDPKAGAEVRRRAKEAVETILHKELGRYEKIVPKLEEALVDVQTSQMTAKERAHVLKEIANQWNRLDSRILKYGEDHAYSKESAENRHPYKSLGLDVAKELSMLPHDAIDRRQRETICEKLIGDYVTRHTENGKKLTAEDRVQLMDALLRSPVSEAAQAKILERAGISEQHFQEYWSTKVTQG